jgi:hypothetical protein
VPADAEIRTKSQRAISPSSACEVACLENDFDPRVLENATASVQYDRMIVDNENAGHFPTFRGEIAVGGYWPNAGSGNMKERIYAAVIFADSARSRTRDKHPTCHGSFSRMRYGGLSNRNGSVSRATDSVAVMWHMQKFEV